MDSWRQEDDEGRFGWLVHSGRWKRLVCRIRSRLGNCAGIHYFWDRPIDIQRKKLLRGEKVCSGLVTILFFSWRARRCPQDVLKVVFKTWGVGGGSYMPTWTPQRGFAPAPLRGPGGHWTPTLFQRFSCWGVSQTEGPLLRQGDDDSGRRKKVEWDRGWLGDSQSCLLTMAYGTIVETLFQYLCVHLAANHE